MILNYAQQFWTCGTSLLSGGCHYWERVIWLVIAVLIINSLIKHTLRLFTKFTGQTRFQWDKVVINAASPPIRGMVWLFAGSYLVFLSEPYVKVLSFVGTQRVFWTVVVFGVLWFSMRLVKGVSEYFVHKMISREDDGPHDISSIKAIAKLANVLSFVIAVVTLLGVYKVPVSGLVTFGGVSGAMIAFSAKDMLGNFFGGLLIYLDRPFDVGEWVSSPDKQIEGTVEYIGWRLTRIRSFAKRPIYVPNGLFNTIVLVNPSRMSNRRIKQNIGLRYEDADRTQTILQAIRDMLKAHPEIDQNQTTLVNLVAFDHSTITFMIYTFTKTTNWVKFQYIQDDVMLKAEKTIRDCGGECAFPTTTLDIPDAVVIDMAAGAQKE
jgi:MscS family membrane protein